MSSDGRGEIFEIGDIGDLHLNVLTVKKGKVRGGHYHNYDEEFSVIYGKIEFHSGYEDQDELTIFHAGDTIVTTPNVPHYVLALEDSVMLEFRPIGTEFKAIDYGPFRKLAEASI